jgi:RNA polymerase sigma-70 factor (ECF subfamily)
LVIVMPGGVATWRRVLPARDRAIVALTFYADHDADEIAAALGMTAGSVRVARHRAVGRLATCMGGA